MRIGSAALFMAAITVRAESPAWSKCPGGHSAIEAADKAEPAGRIVAYRNALAELERQRAGAETLACVEDRLSTAMSMAGQPREAIAHLQRAAERLLELDPKQPTAITTNRLANLYLEARDLRAGERWAGEALRLAKAVFPATHPGELSALNTIAHLHVCRHDYARAEPIYRSVLYHLERIHGGQHTAVGSAADNLAETLMVQGRYAEAAGLYGKAIGAYAATLGPASRELLSAQSGLMVAYARSGRREMAERLAAETLATAERQLAGNDPVLALVLQRAAIVRSLRGDHSSARSACERALRMAEDTRSADSPQLVALLETYAWILRSAKDKKAARRIESRLRSLHSATRQSAPGRRAGDNLEADATRPERPSPGR